MMNCNALRFIAALVFDSSPFINDVYNLNNVIHNALFTDIDEPRSRGRSRGRSRDRDSDNDRDNDRDRDRERDRSREVGGDAGKAFRSDNESNSQTEVGEAVIAFQVRLEVFMCLF